MAEDKKFAVLIDADNVSAKYIKYIMDEISNYGIATYKRIYGDWTKPNTGSWKEILLENSITPVQQYGYTVGKNATDSAMIIDAMDILYSNHVDGFCIVSSDSDFTKLASRLRESGMLIVGMGEKKTPKPFIAACNKFKYLDVLASAGENTQSIKNNKKNGGNISTSKTSRTEDDQKGMTDINIIKASIIKMINESDSENQAINMAELGNRLAKRYPDFDVRNYGDTKLSRFLKKMEFLKIQSDKNEGNSIWVSLKTDEDIDTNKKSISPSKKKKKHHKKK
ncbi:MAG: NYN domain-containing protein [Tissierella sp.]|uniref:NYN domain-containing protein n=1 Tax=Tissierella sp. TaxID=41274 RepID=UPI003F98BA4F